MCEHQVPNLVFFNHYLVHSNSHTLSSHLVGSHLWWNPERRSSTSASQKTAQVGHKGVNPFTLVTRAPPISGSALPKYCQIAVLWILSMLGVTPRYTLAYVRHTLGDSVTLRPSSSSWCHQTSLLETVGTSTDHTTSLEEEVAPYLIDS